MSARRGSRVHFHALPALLRVGFVEAVAYRAQLIVWVLGSTMPLVMLALFSAVAREGPIAGFDGAGLTAYFLATFIVRQLTSSWVSWQINAEVRDGTLSQRLLRPVHPLLAYAAESAAAIPVRAMVAVPIAIVLLFAVGRRELSDDACIWALVVVSLVGAWLLSLSISLLIGTLALFIEASTKVMDLWLAVFFVFSGYLIPVAMFPSAVRAVLDFLPFRYQLGLPVELITGAHGRGQAVRLVAAQWAFVAIVAGSVIALWRRGVARFAAYGG